MFKPSSILLAGLLLTNGAFGNVGFGLFAYPVGEETDLSTTPPTVKSLPIPDEMFYRACYQKLPKSTLKLKEYNNWLATNGIRLVKGGGPCDKSTEQEEWNTMANAYVLWQHNEAASNLKDRLFEPGVIVSKEKASKFSMNHYNNLIKERHLSDEFMKDYEYVLEFHSQCLMGFPNRRALGLEWEKKLNMDPLVISLRDNLILGQPKLTPLSLKPYPQMMGDEKTRNSVVHVNTELQMGDAAAVKVGDGERNGLITVDLYLDRYHNPDIDLFACRGEGKGDDLWLYSAPKRSTENSSKCFRVMLTTSDGQLKHLVALWNHRQLAWTQTHVNIRMTPSYTSKYVLEEKRVGRRPIIYRRDDPNKTPIDLSDIKYLANLGYTGGEFKVTPQKVSDDVARAEGVTKVLNMKRSDTNFKRLPDISKPIDPSAGELIERLDDVVGMKEAVREQPAVDKKPAEDQQTIKAEELNWFDIDMGGKPSTKPSKDNLPKDAEETEDQSIEAISIRDYIRKAYEFVWYLKDNSYTMDDVLDALKRKREL